jgi:hypothetical protein
LIWSLVQFKLDKVKNKIQECFFVLWKKKPRESWKKEKKEARLKD